MTQFYYLSSKCPLDTGTFGEKRVLSKKGNYIFETSLDEASITIKKIENAMITNLSYPYQYEVTTHLGDFGVNKTKLNEMDRKCLHTLLDYLKESIHKSFVIEFYTAWAEEERLELKNRKEIVIDELNDPEQLKINNLEKVILYCQKKLWE